MQSGLQSPEKIKPSPEIITEAEFKARYGETWRTCEACNYDRHICLGCGEYLLHDSKTVSRTYNHYKQKWFRLLTPHWLSDCRPDVIDGSYNGTTTTDGRMT